MSPAGERGQCPFCLSYRKLRKDGALPHHRLSSGKICSGSDLTRDEAKALKAEGAPISKSSGRPDSPSEQTGLLEDDLPF